MATIEERLARIEAVQDAQAETDAGVVLLLLEIRGVLVRVEAIVTDIQAAP